LVVFRSRILASVLCPTEFARNAGHRVHGGLECWGAVDYRQFRFRIKEIAQQTLASVEHAEIISDAALRALALAGKVPPDALVVFVDDDDWLAPHLFSRLREFASVGAGVDGFRWGLVRLGRDRYNLDDADAGFALHPTVILRPIDEEGIYTNGYAVSGAALGRLGVDAVCEHLDAYTSTKPGGSRPTPWHNISPVPTKHPAHNVAARALLDSEEYRRDLCPRKIEMSPHVQS